MKKNPIVIVLIVATGGFLIWLLLRKNTTATPSVTTNTNATTGTGCIQVPDNFPKFNTAVTPSGAQEFLGVPDAQFTDGFQQRLLGFFVSLDVEPDGYIMKYFGKEAIAAYLNSQDGQLAHWQVVKGSRRCQSTNTTYKLI